MKNSLRAWQIAGFIFTGVLGVLLHFLYDWTNQNGVVALFSAVNESIWEHNKLVFFPMFIFSLIENRYIGKEYKSFWCVKLIGMVLGIIIVPVLYYTINGIFGTTPDWVNIAIFFVAVAICYVLETFHLENGHINCKSPARAFLILCIIAVIFAVFTYAPPQIPLFQDPIPNTFGI